MACIVCLEEFAPDDEFAGQFIECPNCKLRWHPHPEAPFSTCPNCHMELTSLDAFDNLKSQECLMQVGKELIETFIKKNDPIYRSIHIRIKRMVEAYLDHRPYASDYVKLINFLEKYLNEFNGTKGPIELRDLIETHSSKAENVQVLELLYEAFRLHVGIKVMSPPIRIRYIANDKKVILEFLPKLKALYPELIDITGDMFNALRENDDKQHLVRSLTVRFYNKLSKKREPDLSFTRVGICPLCEAAPVYVDGEQYICAGCRVHVCRRCFKPLDANHTCRKEDIDEWNILLRETRACPQCGFRFGHHSRCDSMFCTNCKCGFHYYSGELIKGSFENSERTDWLRSIGRQNQNIAPTLRQLPKGLRRDVVERISEQASHHRVYGAIVKFVRGRWHAGQNLFKSIASEIRGEANCETFKLQAANLIALEFMREKVTDFDIEILEIAEMLNGRRNATNNDLDDRFDNAIVKIVAFLHRLHLLLPSIHDNRLLRFETEFMDSITKYLDSLRTDTYRYTSISINDLSSFPIELKIPPMITKAFADARAVLREVLATRVQRLGPATSIDEIVNEYRRRFDIPAERGIEAYVRRHYHLLTRNEDGTWNADKIGAVTVADVVGVNVRAIKVDGEPAPPTFKYSQFIGKPIPVRQSPQQQPAQAPQAQAPQAQILRQQAQQLRLAIQRREQQREQPAPQPAQQLARRLLLFGDAVRIREVLEAYVTWIGGPLPLNVDDFRIRHHGGFRRLYYSDREGFYYIEGRANHISLTYDEFLDRDFLYVRARNGRFIPRHFIASQG